MTADQLAFGIDLPHRSITDETASILALMNGDPIHRSDRERIVQAILYVANHSAGIVDPNKVRTRLTAPSGDLLVYPRLMGAVYRQLAQAGVLAPAGWIVNEDRHGRNAGRPMRCYRLRRQVVAA